MALAKTTTENARAQEKAYKLADGDGVDLHVSSKGKKMADGLSLRGKAEKTGFGRVPGCESREGTREAQ